MPKRKTPRIAVVGSANVDLTCFTDRFPKPGETILGDSFHLGFGGKGANQAVAARLCGATTDMVARVGDDLFGPATARNFRDAGIGVRHVKPVRGVSTGVAPIFVESTGQNRILVVKGANDRLTPRVVDAARELLKRADAIVLQLEIPVATVYHTVRLARRLGVPCILNPAPAAPLDFRALAGVDYLVPNESEAESLTGVPVRDGAGAEACARELLGRGVRRVILTLGERGALVAGPEGLRHVPAFPVRAVDTTGAGDAFIGSFASFLGEGCDELEAVERASLYAALSTTAPGTQRSFASRSRFDREWRARRR